ncbi:MAP kinase kinase (MEK) [Physocladia obscura]|uniref:mitogen-activated protein kinase kinase n=1 Tax=Physocladia obscura TaxID=109957 RepID=A0AAD5XES4_9FUNG|nr:MAP kinase kinase (MEK) [Physocladia obscura]
MKPGLVIDLRSPLIDRTPGSLAPQLTPTEINDLISNSHTADEIKYADADFEFMEELGSGAGGSVAKVFYRPTNTIMARKYLSVIVDNEMDRKNAKRNLKRELKILHRCDSEFIVRSFGAYSAEAGVYLVMEYMDLGSLEAVYKTCGPIDQHIGAKIAVRTLSGLLYLQKMEIVHRDIKPSNLLLNRLGQVKIADFGVSKELINTQARTFTGTQGYLAPERINSGQVYGIISDIWSLGLTLMELVTGKFPYSGNAIGSSGNPSEQMGLFDLIEYIKAQPAPSLPDGFEKDFVDLVTDCVIKDHEKRPGPENLLEYPCCIAAKADGCNLKPWVDSLASKMVDNS